MLLRSPTSRFVLLQDQGLRPDWLLKNWEGRREGETSWWTLNGVFLLLLPTRGFALRGPAVVCMEASHRYRETCLTQPPSVVCKAGKIESSGGFYSEAAGWTSGCKG